MNQLLPPPDNKLNNNAISNMTQTLRQKLHSSKYFSTRLILVFDLLICIAATILAVGITSWLVPGHTHEHNANII